MCALWLSLLWWQQIINYYSYFCLALMILVDFKSVLLFSCVYQLCGWATPLTISHL